MTDTKITPTKIERQSDGGIRIFWSDDSVREYTVKELRDHCPCATCREKGKAPPPAAVLPVLSEADMRPLTIQAMKPVGAYAYGIEFSDNHNSGIFTFEFLSQLGVKK